MSSCYEPIKRGNQGETIGWCGTCVPEAKKGDPGYCGSDQNMSVDENENSEILTVYPNSTSWGFCDRKCHTPKPVDENMLQVSIRH